MNKLITNYEILEIKEIISETDTIKTFIFDWNMERDKIPTPGQFVMVWSFSRKRDEKPMSISIIDISNNKIGITVKKVGGFTEELHNLSVGDKLGIRGPYGNGFDVNNLENKNIIAIGGGVGMAPISCFTTYAKEKKANVDVVCASVTKDELLFPQKLKNEGANVFTCTDDGTCGFEGFATHRTIDLLKTKTYDMAVVCGPELMMKGTFDLLEDHNILAQYSMERYMKCAMGICGQCCVDNTGWRICVEGPVFFNSDVKKIIEFGKYHRDASGIKNKF
ncbi:dihydroorotate dehydrogenase electron transfer subunit [Methanobrevibacter sp. TMH8]|uniref:dihydroorotate dehydrogenase electron transfer subunit n=1 Tax=Methanobrevibacter sp. TMH8 TaxID=2848611 RepID=UPI001CC9B831|nr:dihydroorotate dehydrogenase electron transfer subunit [Methanobrevibacter sp. TMH8]MBZ9571434.1 dihydroorotate dehydrogenase electron transfer subunit [Methanobrevibacter sp. TMH8]